MRIPPKGGQATPASLRLSILITCTEDWPGIREMMDSLTPQLAGPVEAILLSSRARALPDGWHHPKVRVVTVEGASTFRLRAVGLVEAAGEIVAFTEDHASVTPGWVGAILQAHEDPGTSAACGPVLIGAPGLASARVHHLLLFGDFTPPLQPERVAVLPIANFSFRRDALGWDSPQPPPDYWFEGTAIQRLARTGNPVFAPAMRAYHTQAFGAWKAARAHYHNARASAAMAKRPSRILGAMYGTQRWLRERGRQARRDLGKIEEPVGPMRASLVLLPILGASFAGFCAGWLFGAGKSAEKVH